MCTEVINCTQSLAKEDEKSSSKYRKLYCRHLGWLKLEIKLIATFEVKQTSKLE